MAHGGDPEQPLGSGSPSQAQRVREHRLDSQSSPETLDPCDSSPARSADDAEEVGSSKPAWLRFNAPSEIEIIPDGTPAEITSVITRSLQNFRAEKIAEEAKANVSVLTRSDDQSPCAIIKDDMEVSNGPQTTPSISREGGSQVDQSSRRHHHSSNTSATSSSSVSAAQTHSAETSSSSVSSRLPAAHSSTNVIDSKPVSRRRRQPVSAMGPLGLTTFYAPLPINSRPSAVHQKSPRAEALRKYFKGKKEFSECASCLETMEHKKLVLLSCQHRYCRECFTQLILTAVRDENYFPPKCCLQEVPTKQIQSHLNTEQKRTFQLKAREYAVAAGDRWYCPKATCAKWIDLSPRQFRDGNVKCPHCRTKICRLCRGQTHGAGVECPQDFELQATLEESERNGWMRCYSCRAMVELNQGCRHITCKCRAQFCYVCGAKWRKCHCTGDYQGRRQAQMQRQVAATPAEAEEIAAAVAAVDEAERREAREVEILHRLEEIAEHKRREAEIIEERRREQIRLQEIRNRFPYLKRRLDDVHAAQRAALQRRHDEIMGLAVKQLSDVQDDHSKRKAESISQLESDSRAASGDLASSHRQQLQEMEARHEEEEDDYFLGIRAHLRGKPNREAREQAAVAKVKKAQAEDREALIAKHEAELTTLTHNGDRLLRNTIASMDADQERELAEMKSNQESCARQHAAEHLILEKIVEDRQAILLDDERTLIDSGSTLSSYRRIAAESLSFGADQNVSGAEFAVSTDVETSHYPASSSEGIEMPDVLSRGHPLKSRRPLKDSHSTITWGASWVSSASPDSPASNLGEEDSTFQPQELGIACQ